MMGARRFWVKRGAGFFGTVLLGGFVAGRGLLGFVPLGVVVVVVVDVDVVLVDVEVVVVVVVEPPSGAAAPPLAGTACATGAHSAHTPNASARYGSMCLGEVIEKMSAGAPQTIWNTPESATSRW